VVKVQRKRDPIASRSIISHAMVVQLRTPFTFTCISQRVFSRVWSRGLRPRTRGSKQETRQIGATGWQPFSVQAELACHCWPRDDVALALGFYPSGNPPYMPPHDQLSAKDHACHSEVGSNRHYVCLVKGWRMHQSRPFRSSTRSYTNHPTNAPWLPWDLGASYRGRLHRW